MRQPHCLERHNSKEEKDPTFYIIDQSWGKIFAKLKNLLTCEPKKKNLKNCHTREWYEEHGKVTRKMQKEINVNIV